MQIKDVRGFNYHGSWGTSGLDLWQHHDHGTMALEVARGKRHFPGWNTVRWWLSHEAFQRNPDRFLAHFEAGLTIFEQHEITVVPVLFNRWASSVAPFGGVTFDLIFGAFGPENYETLEESGRTGEVTGVMGDWYLKSLDGYLNAIGANYARDPRILAWDLCNEPFSTWNVEQDSVFRRSEFSWLTWCRNTFKATGVIQPLTIGSLFELASIKLVEPLCDIVGLQAYYIPHLAGRATPGAAAPQNATKAGFLSMLDDVVAFAGTKGKPVLAIETAYGSVDDMERADIARESLSALAARDIGILAYALHHSLVADLHAPEYGPLSIPGRMEFITADGAIRPGHDVFNDFT